ncbi:MAG: DMT family transporter [Alphaproteobacteria bacterium]|nr:DMT family transporter [Alphaproteobacteria bacterium]
MNNATTQPDSVLLDKVHTFLQNNPLFKWFFKPGYLQGVFWANMISIVAVSNDVAMRFLGERLDVIEIAFFRFFFSMIVLLPFMLLQGTNLFKTKMIGMHAARGIIGAAAIALCCWSVNVMPLAQSTSLMFMQPLFFLPLAFFLLKEHVAKERWIATLVGFAGLLYIIRPGTTEFHIYSFIPLSAAFLFATLDILAKKMVASEKTLTLLFHFGLVTSLISLPFLFPVWQMPTQSEFFYLILLGIGGNLIQVCLFLAFSATEASALAPFRYGEFVVSALFGYLFFSQVPTTTLLVGSSIIIASAFYLSHKEIQLEKVNNAQL